MARKRKEDAEKTRRRIIASALALFCRKGYDHTTFDDIAGRLRLTKGAVYWYFKTKESLLEALVALAMERFRHNAQEMMPEGELTFPAVAEMMVKTAVRMVSEPKGAAFFKLMKCQLRWSDTSMERLREDIMADSSCGPKQMFRRAIANDIRAGRARPEVNAGEVTAVCMSIWDGLVQYHLDHFLQCDLKATMEHAFGAIWDRIRIQAKQTTDLKQGGKHGR